MRSPQLSLLAAVLCVALLRIRPGMALDQERALQATLNSTDVTCADVAADGRCSDLGGALGVLCATSCGLPHDPCQDAHAVLDAYWRLSVSTADGAMTCSRARAALTCLSEPVAGLCGASCLRCYKGAHADETPAQYAAEFNQYREILLAEKRQAEWQCAVQRKDADYACDVKDVQCPPF